MVAIKKSKPIGKIAKGDIVKVDGRRYKVDAHYDIPRFFNSSIRIAAL